MNTKKVAVMATFFDGGDEENRTPVQKYIPKNFSECSQLIFIRRSKFN